MMVADYEARMLRLQRTPLTPKGLSKTQENMAKMAKMATNPKSKSPVQM